MSLHPFRSLWLLALLTAGTARAQDAPRDTKVQAVVDQTIAAYKALSSFYEEVRARSTVNGSDTPSDFDRFDLALQRPNKLRLRSTQRQSGKTIERWIVCDGAKVWRWTSATNTYTVAKAPALLTKIEGLPDWTPEMDALFLDRDPFKISPMAGTSLALAPPSKVGDADVDVLEMKNTEDPGTGSPSAIRVMIDQKSHLIREVTLEGTSKDDAGKPLEIRATIEYVTVDAAPTLTAADFTFTPPPGAKLDAPPAPKKTPAKPAKPRRKRHS